MKEIKFRHALDNFHVRQLRLTDDVFVELRGESRKQYDEILLRNFYWILNCVTRELSSAAYAYATYIWIYILL